MREPHPDHRGERVIVNPKQFTPQTAMPITGISEREARDVAAYLYRLQ
jgi:cytochrome c1